MKKCPKRCSEGLWSNCFAVVGGIKKQRYKCKTCEYQFTKDTTQEYPTEMKLKAIQMLRESVGFRGIGRLLGVSLKLFESG